jgi:predicted ABC-type ATPase
MSYKIIVLAPSAGGKSTLMRYLRKYTDLHISETDEEVLKANSNIWPTDNNYKNQVLVPQTTEEIIKKEDIIFFASYIPTELIRKAKENGFRIIVINLTLEQLAERNKKRMNEENYDDATPWFKGQLDDYQRLSEEDLIDEKINGNQPVLQIAEEIIKLTK